MLNVYNKKNMFFDMNNYLYTSPFLKSYMLLLHLEIKVSYFPFSFISSFF